MRRRYDTGGLADAAGVNYDDEDNSAMPGGGLAVASGAARPNVASSVQSSRDTNKMAYQNAIERLKQGREALLAMKSSDQSSKWLALAQGMLAPTRTGGFGESVGNAAGLIRQQAEMSDRNALARQTLLQNINQQESQAEGQYSNRDIGILGREAAAAAAGSPGSTKVQDNFNVTIPAGERSRALGLDPNREHVVRVNKLVAPDGTVTTEIAAVDGNVLEVAATVNPETVRQTTRAGQEVGASTGFMKADIDRGLGAMDVVPQLMDGLDLMQKIKANGGTTSGLRADILRGTEYLGITKETMPMGVDLLTIQQKMGQAVLNKLMKLTGSKTDFEYQKMEEQLARMGTNVDTNMKILEGAIGEMQGYIDIGREAANVIEDPSYKKYATGRFSKFDEKIARRGKSTQRTREAPPEAIELLKQNLGSGVDQKRELDAFKKRYDIPEDVVVELRKMGVGI